MAVDYIQMTNDLAKLGMMKRESDANVLAAQERLSHSQAMNPMLQQAQAMQNQYSQQVNPLLINSQTTANAQAQQAYELAQQIEPYKIKQAKLEPQLSQSTLDSQRKERQIAGQNQDWERQDRQAAESKAQQKAVRKELKHEQNQILSMSDQLKQTKEGSPERAQMAQQLLSQTVKMKHLGERFAGIDPANISDQALRELDASIMMQQGQGVSDQEFQQVKGSPGMTFNATTGRYQADNEMMEKAVEMKRKAGDGMITGEALHKVNKDLTPIIKETQEIVTSTKELEALRSSNNATDQLAAVFKFMKALDPTSVVRESEQSLVYSASGAGAQFANMMTSLVEGKKLPEGAFDNVVRTAQTLAATRSNATREQVDLFLAPIKDNLGEVATENLKARVPTFDPPQKQSKQQQEVLNMFEGASQEEQQKFLNELTPEERKTLGL